MSCSWTVAGSRGLPCPTPLDEEDRELLRRVLARNRAAAEQCCATLAAETVAGGLTARIRIEESRQVAEALDGVVREEEPGIVVRCAHGAGKNGGALPPWSYGSVAHPMLLHPRRPILVLQDEPPVAKGAFAAAAAEAPARGPGPHAPGA